MSDIPHRLQTALAERYRFVRELGRGGMATVYLVHDLAHDRPAALKVLHPDLTASLGGDRFLREIELGRTLVHPHIMGMYESGEADGLLYYVMPFVDGESLRDRLDRERQLSIDDTVALTRQVAEALGYAHAQGVVHRDIKPENILLERTPAGDRVIVADFGVARAVTVAGGETLTKTGMAVGTVVYMSPEQAAGSRDVTPASDQYSLACVVYEMLTGQPPFTGPTAMSIMARHAMDTVPGLRIVRGAIPEEMEAAVLCALEKVPADRFATVEQFAQALTTPGAARPRPRTTTVVLPGRRAPARRRRAALLSLLAVPALAGAWAGWRHWGAPDAELALAGAAARRVAVLYLAHPVADSALGYLADGLSEDLMDELGRVPTLRVISRNGVAPFRGRALAPDSVARALDVGMVVNGAVERAGDRIRVKLALVNGSTGRVLERTEVAQPQGEVLAMRDTLAGRAAELIRKRLGEEIQLRERRASTRSAEAWGLAQQAEAARQRADSAQQRGDSAAVTRAFARADSLLARAQGLDERWTLPLVQRGRLAYERARLTGADPLKEGLIAQGLDYANQALQRDARDPDALELRGTLRYWRYLLGLERDDVAQRQLVTDAKADLLAAVKQSPNQAEALRLLAHLYARVENDDVNAKEYAERAYAADAYLRSADEILSRLFLTSYDLGRLADATHWCAEGTRRFAQTPKLLRCRLWLMTMNGERPDPRRARALTDTLVALTPPARQAFERLYDQMIVAAVLARAGQADSARRLARASQGDASVDPTRDILLLDAFVQTLLGDTTAALRSLKLYLGANPDRRGPLAEDSGWWFKPIANDPRFLALVDAKP